MQSFSYHVVSDLPTWDGAIEWDVKLGHFLPQLGKFLLNDNIYKPSENGEKSDSFLTL